MPTTSFFKVCRKHYGKANVESFEKPRQTTQEEEADDGLHQEPEPAGYRDESDDESDTEPPEWEIGIRRTANAQGRDVDELTLSDIVLDPDGNVAFYWMGLVTLAVVYNLAVVVMRLAFHEMRQQAIQDSVFYALDLTGDVIYVLDIVVHMRISYYEDGCLVLEPGKIAATYTSRRKFVLDVLAAIPLGSIYSCVTGVCRMLYLDVTEGNLPMVLTRLPRLLKFSTMTKFFDVTDSRTRYPNMVRASRLFMNLWIVIHWIGCIYYMMSEYEGLGTTAWVYPNGTEHNRFTRKYIRVIYWSLMTLTTIGERPPPETDVEFVFTGFTFLIGVFVFAAVVGNVGDVISNMNSSRQDFQTRIDQIKFYLQHRGVPEALQNRVKRWANYTWTRTQAIDEPALLQMLPDRLRTEIAINVHLETLRKVKLFEECEEGLLRELVLKLRPQVYSPGGYICRIGEIGKEMFIVNHGKVEILVLNIITRRRTVIATLGSGNYFGEISLLKLGDGQNRRTADVRAVGYSELLRLSRKDLISALAEYPNAKQLLEAQARERIAKTQEVRRQSVDDIPEAAHLDLSKKKNVLQNVIQSEKFQKILRSRNTEMTEMRSILAELKSFDSQNMKKNIEHLSEEMRKLKQQLCEKDIAYERLRRKYSKLKHSDRQAVHAKQNGVCGGAGSLPSKHGRSGALLISDFNNDISDASDNESLCMASTQGAEPVDSTAGQSIRSSPISSRHRNAFTYNENTDFEFKTLCHSVSDPESLQNTPNFHYGSSSADDNMQPSTQERPSGWPATSIPVINISQSTDDRSIGSLLSADTEVALDTIHDWLRLDELETPYLSDTSTVSCSTDSSDDTSDMDLDLPGLPASDMDLDLHGLPAMSSAI